MKRTDDGSYPEECGQAVKLIEFCPGWERMDKRQYGAIPLVAVCGYWFRIHFCKTWLFGYQFWHTNSLSPSHSIMLCIIPFIGFEVGVWRIR